VELKLIDEKGRIKTGIFDHPIAEINYNDFDYRTPMGKKAGLFRRWFGFNQFQFIGAISDSLIMGCGIANVKLIAVSFVYFYAPKTQKLVEYSFQTPLAVGCRLSLIPDHGESHFFTYRNKIRMVADKTSGTKRLILSLKGGIDVDAIFSDAAPLFHPMRICTKAGCNGWVYAQKVAGAPIKGSIRCPLGQFDLQEINAFAHHDYSAGYMRRETFWNWACFSGQTTEGDLLGLNVSCGVNETSFTENCVWLNGNIIKIDTVKFEYDPEQLRNSWHISSYDGKISLQFIPEGQHAEKKNYFILASNFHQLYGRFQGNIHIDGQQAIQIRDMYGFVEEHFARW
jgi:hypothetical protein